MSSGPALPFTDIHCHLLPGLDDGPAHWDDALALARCLVADGIGTVIATPHQLGCHEANTVERIHERTAEAQRRVRAAGIPLRVLPGGDARVRDHLPALVRAGRVATLGGRGRHVLLELPHDICLPLGRMLYELDAAEVVGILSHPERNPALMGDHGRLRAWVEQGCLVQITAASVVGDFGAAAQRACRRLIDDQLVHFVATDAHNVHRRPPRMRLAFEQVIAWSNRALATRLFISNPQAVADGRVVRPPLPISA